MMLETASDLVAATSRTEASDLVEAKLCTEVLAMSMDIL